MSGPNFLKQSTASQTRILGPFIDDTDFKTAETGLTIANTDVKLSKNGASAVNKNSGGGTHIVNGRYAFTFNATDTNTVGELDVSIVVSGALQVTKTFHVLEEDIYDALFGALAAGFDENQRVDVGSWLSSSVTLSTNEYPNVNVKEISEDSAAADKLEAALEASATGTIASDLFYIQNDFQSSTDLKDLVDNAFDPALNLVYVDVKRIDADATAAQNLKNQYDGITGLSGNLFPARQDQITGFGFVGGVLNQVAESFTLTTGTVIANDYTATHAEDNVRHQIADAAGTLECYYQFDIGPTGTPSGVTIIGALTGSNDDLVVRAWNWNTSSWDTIRDYAGTVSSNNLNRSGILLSDHVGTGVNDGLVRISFYGTGLTTANLYVDQLYVTYGITQSAVGYADGSIWIDTNNGESGAVPGVNGTADRPVDNLADAILLSNDPDLGLKRFTVAQGSYLALTQTMQYYEFRGIDYVIDLSNQTLDNVVITGAVLNGNCSGGTGSILLTSCKFGQCAFPEVAIIDGALSNVITATEAGDYVFERCFSVIAGLSTPVFDFGELVGSVNLSFRHYSGGLEIRNMGQSGDDKLSLEGWGQLIIASSCVGGTIAVRGNFTVTDNSGGAITCSGDARYDVQQIRDALKRAPTAGAPAADSIDDDLSNIYTDTQAIKAKTDDLTFGVANELNVNVKSLVDEATPAEILREAIQATEYGTVGVGAHTTSYIQASSITALSNDALKYRVINFKSGVNKGRSAPITNYTAGTGEITLDSSYPLVAAPSNGDEFTVT